MSLTAQFWSSPPGDFSADWRCDCGFRCVQGGIARPAEGATMRCPACESAMQLVEVRRRAQPDQPRLSL